MQYPPHGGNIFAYNVTHDFSANINPLGMPDGVRRAVIDSAGLWEHYPDPDCTALVQALVAYEHIPADCIVCGNGADDLLYRIAGTLRPMNAVVPAPAFGEYERALRSVGCHITQHFLQESEQFMLTERILPLLTPDIDLLLLCSPHNPTGQCISRTLLEKITNICRENSIRLVLDACFLELSQDRETAFLPLTDGNIVLKAFTKSHAIPGLRLGYALCADAETAAALRQSGQFWSVSAPAQAAGVAAVSETAYLQTARRLIAQERAFLTEELTRLGAAVYPSDANFLLFRSVPGLDEQLLRQGILIRNCGNYAGLDARFYRIAVRMHPENVVLLEAMRRCI